MDRDSLKIIGTSHISKDSVNTVKDALKEDWDIIAVELDPRRAASLFAKGKRPSAFQLIRAVGVKGYLFGLIGEYVENKLGDVVKVKPGTEMKVALQYAKKHDIMVAFIDRDIEITLRRFSRSLTWKEKWHFVEDMVKGLIFKKQAIKFDLTKVPPDKLIEYMLGEVKERYPNIYKTLIVERNEFMGNRLISLLRKYPDKKIIAIMGAGHVDAVKGIIDEPITYSFTAK